MVLWRALVICCCTAGSAQSLEVFSALGPRLSPRGIARVPEELGSRFSDTITGGDYLVSVHDGVDDFILLVPEQGGAPILPDPSFAFIGEANLVLADPPESQPLDVQAIRFGLTPWGTAVDDAFLVLGAQGKGSTSSTGSFRGPADTGATPS